MGIDYGTCPQCTPQWVLEARRDFQKRYREVHKSVQEKYAEIIRQEIEDIIRQEREEYNLVFEAGREWYKNKINNEQP